jgi:Polyketide cyclase / dehydrase and lipid transport
MSVDVTVEQQIARPPDAVAGFAMDPANDRRWIGALTDVRVISDGPVGPGTRVERVASFLGKRIEYVNEIVEYRPPERLTMRSVRAPFPMTLAYEFAPADGGTLARIRTEGDPGGFYAIAAPLLAAMVRRGVARDLATLRRVLEDENNVDSDNDFVDDGTR